MSNGGSWVNMGMTIIGGEWKGDVVKLIWVAISGCQRWATTMMAIRVAVVGWWKWGLVDGGWCSRCWRMAWWRWEGEREKERKREKKGEKERDHVGRWLHRRWRLIADGIAEMGEGHGCGEMREKEKKRERDCVGRWSHRRWWLIANSTVEMGEGHGYGERKEKERERNRDILCRSLTSSPVMIDSRLYWDGWRTWVWKEKGGKKKRKGRVGGDRVVWDRKCELLRFFEMNGKDEIIK